MATVAPSNNRTAAKPNRAVLVMIVLHADSPTHRKNI
jgi:hypothetical protein